MQLLISQLIEVLKGKNGSFRIRYSKNVSGSRYEMFSCLQFISNNRAALRSSLGNMGTTLRSSRYLRKKLQTSKRSSQFQTLIWN